MYKVSYYKLAKMADGTIGNLSQGSGTCYTDYPINEIENQIYKFLESKKQVCVITCIETVSAHVISKENGK